MQISDLVAQLLITIVSVSPVVIVQLRQTMSVKKDSKVIMDSLKETYAQNNKLNEIITNHVERSEFSSELHGIIQARSANIIRLCQLDARYKSVLKTMANLLEDLAFKYYYNKYRKIKHEIIDFLDVEMEDIETTIKRITKHSVTDTKTYKYGSGGSTKEVTISFYDFIYDEVNKNPFKFLRILRIALEENGFDTIDGPDFIETMDKFTKLILVSFIEEVKEWNKIKDISNDR